MGGAFREQAIHERDGFFEAAEPGECQRRFTLELLVRKHVDAVRARQVRAGLFTHLERLGGSPQHIQTLGLVSASGRPDGVRERRKLLVDRRVDRQRKVGPSPVRLVHGADHLAMGGKPGRDGHELLDAVQRALEAEHVARPMVGQELEHTHHVSNPARASNRPAIWSKCSSSRLAAAKSPRYR